MGVKFSDIENLSERVMVIENGKPYWKENELNGEIKFSVINEELGKKIQENVLSKMENNMDEDKLAYMLIPYLTDIIDDITFVRYKNMINSKNEVILTLSDGILDLFESMINYADKSQELKEKSNKIMARIPQIDEIELKKQQLDNLYNDFATSTNTKERDEILKEIIKIKNELGD